MIRNRAFTPVEKTEPSSVTVTCDDCQRQQTVELSAPVIRSDRRPNGVIESTCPECGETTVTGFRYTDDR